MTDSNKPSAVPPLTSDGQIFNEAKYKAELLNNTFASNARLHDEGTPTPQVSYKKNIKKPAKSSLP